MNQQTLWSHHEVRAQKTQFSCLSFIRSVLHSFNTTPTSVTSDWWITCMHRFVFVWNISAPRAGSEQVQTSFCLTPFFFPMHQPVCLFPSLVCSLSLSLCFCWNLSALSQESRFTEAQTPPAHLTIRVFELGIRQSFSERNAMHWTKGWMSQIWHPQRKEITQNENQMKNNLHKWE